MNNQKNKIAYIIALIVIAFTASSCVDDLNVTPINPQVTQTFNQDEVFAKVYASYALTGQEGPSGKGDIEGLDEGRFSIYRCLWNCNELSTDEAICSWTDAEVLELNFNNWTSQSTITDGMYARLYFTVTICNHFLEQTIGKTDDATVKQRAEVRFLRATAYYYLLDMFGNVPFTEVVSLTPPTQMKRAKLFEYVEKELLECSAVMYEPRTAPYYRVDKAAAWLLLSRLYLNSEVYTYVQATVKDPAVAGTARWNDAAIYAKKVIDSAYKLNPNFRQLFMGDNAGAIDGSGSNGKTANTAPQEIIFPIAADGTRTQAWGNSLFLIASTHAAGMLSWGTTELWNGNRARADLYKKFVPSGSTFYNDYTDLTSTKLASYKDDRALFCKQFYNLIDGKIVYVDGKIVNTLDPVLLNLSSNPISDNKHGYRVIKFTNNRADSVAPNDPKYPDMDVPFMRSAEAYLNYGEAVLRGGATVEGYPAIDAINELRTRAHAPAFNTTTNLLTLPKILDERAREFFFEGYRRMDLIRFNKYGGTTGYTWEFKGGDPVGKDFPADYNLFPIPANDLNANANLSQNPGY